MIHPAQRICHGDSTLYCAIGQTISAYDCKTHEYRPIWTAAPLTTAEKGKNIRNRSVIELAVSNQYLVWISEDKMLRVLNTSSSTLVSERELVKRGCSISIDDDIIVVGDKFGDVYQFSITASADSANVDQQKPVLGHVSMLTSVILTPAVDGKRALITADRDEHIRISNFPDGYNIRTYCLGHTQFVSALAPMPDGTFLSGGGDEYLATWDISSGRQTNKVALTGPLKEAKQLQIGLTVIKMIPFQQTKALVLFQGLCHIYLYDIQAASQLYALSLASPALDMTLVDDSTVMVSLDTSAQNDNDGDLFSCWHFAMEAHQVRASTIDQQKLNTISKRDVDVVEYTIQTSDLLRKKTKAEIEASKEERKSQEESESVDKELKRAMEEDQARTERLMKKVKA